MDNVEELWCHTVQTNEKDYGEILFTSFVEGLACLVTRNNYVCFNERNTLNTVSAKQVKGEIGTLKCAQFLTKDLVFWATAYNMGTIHKRSLETNICYETDKPIVALCWNHTLSLLVVINNIQEMFTFTFLGASFQKLNVGGLNSSVPDSVYVGWGSENTQFRGPKALKNKDVETIEVERVIDDGPPQISWRSNSEQFAVNYHKEGKRYIKIFDKDLNPLFQTQEYVNLQQPVSFMGQGQCLASCAVAKNINQIVIFEKNCMVKNFFEVRENLGTVKHVLFHPKISMLAVHSVDLQENSYINIYMNSNAKWYLKQQLLYPQARKVRGLEWTNPKESLNTFCELVVFTSQHIEYHTFRFIINRCRHSTQAAVVDGKTVAFYAFKRNNVPPPLFSYSLDFNRPINRILFHPARPLYIFIDSAFQVRVVEYTKPELNIILETENLSREHIISFARVLFEYNNIEIFLEYDGDEIIARANQINDVSLRIQSFKKGTPSYVIPFNDITDCALSYKELTTETQNMVYITKYNIEDIEFEIGLTSDLQMCVNDQVVCNGVTSFLIFQEYFIFTHIDANLYCINLQNDYNLLFTTFNLKTIFSREIEKGARIVSNNNNVPPDIILILPRGNFELINCRLITIDIIEKLLEDNNWELALSIMRDARVNWNLLIDLNPERFVTHIEDFVAASKKCTMVSTIVNEFSDSENCLKGVYSYCFSKISKLKKNTIDIVKKILDHLVTTDCIGNLLSIVAIQQKHISVKAALSSIRDIFEIDQNAHEPLCAKATIQLLIQGNLIEVLNAAYCFYNLDFLRFVYGISGEDPLVYEPEIQSLSELSGVKLRFQMCSKGNNAKCAIKYLLRCDDYDENYLTDFILKHSIQGIAYNNLPENCRYFVVVSKLYARWLSLHQKYAEAGLVYKRAKLNAEALEEYKKSLEWREVINLLDLVDMDRIEQNEVLESLSEQLMKQQRYDEAVTLLEHYNKDPLKAVQMLVANKGFRKALLVAKTPTNCSIDIEAEILSPLRNYITSLVERIDETKIKFENYTDRLLLVRIEKKAKLLIDDGEDVDDMYSETGSIASQGSRLSSRSRGSTLSSRNRRKEARKKTDLREGGYYEDIALIRALYIIIIDVFNMGNDVREICLLLDQGDIEIFRNLHEKLATLQDYIKSRIPEIWCSEFYSSSDTQDPDILAIVRNKEDLDELYRRPPLDDLLDTTWRLEMLSQA